MSASKINPFTHLDVQLESAADLVAKTLRKAIIDGRLTQGTYLRESPLAEQFRVSRNTIREATQILVGEHLVTKQMHRGHSSVSSTPTMSTTSTGFAVWSSCRLLLGPMPAISRAWSGNCGRRLTTATEPG